MNYITAVSKLLASVILVCALLFCVAMSLVLVPIILASRNASLKRSVLLELVPMGLIAGLLWRLWEPPRIRHAIHPGFDGIGRRRRGITKAEAEELDDIPF